MLSLLKTHSIFSISSLPHTSFVNVPSGNMRSLLKTEYSVEALNTVQIVHTTPLVKIVGFDFVVAMDGSSFYMLFHVLLWDQSSPLIERSSSHERAAHWQFLLLSLGVCLVSVCTEFFHTLSPGFSRTIHFSRPYVIASF